MEMEKQEMLGQYFFPEDLEIEEKQLLIQKTEYYRDRESLPKEIIKPVELLYDEEGDCVGYSFINPEFPCLSLKQLFQKEKQNSIISTVICYFLLRKKCFIS